MFFGCISSFSPSKLIETFDEKEFDLDGVQLAGTKSMQHHRCFQCSTVGSGRPGVGFNPFKGWFEMQKWMIGMVWDDDFGKFLHGKFAGHSNSTAGNDNVLDDSLPRSSLLVSRLRPQEFQPQAIPSL